MAHNVEMQVVKKAGHGSHFGSVTVRYFMPNATARVEKGTVRELLLPSMRVAMTWCAEFRNGFFRADDGCKKAEFPASAVPQSEVGPVMGPSK